MELLLKKRNIVLALELIPLCIPINSQFSSFIYLYLYLACICMYYIYVYFTI